jgi:hypothetical protein
MELTPEERQRIYEEEKVRLEAQESLRRDSEARAKQVEIAKQPIVTNKNWDNGKTFLKILGGIFAVVIFLRVWFIAVPGLILWYIYKKSPFSSERKKVATIVTVVIFVLLDTFAYISSRPPKLTIDTPENNISVQQQNVSVTGSVNPAAAGVSINGQTVSVNDDGRFEYNAALNEGRNTLSFIAKNAYNQTTTALTIDRVLTSEEKTQQEVEAKTKQEEHAKALQAEADKKISDQKDRLQKEIEDLNKPLDTKGFRGSVTNLQIELALFYVWAGLVDEAKGSTDPGVNSLGKRLATSVRQLQMKEFPLMRKEYAGLMGKTLWEQNIDVYTTSQGSSTLELVGGVLASNKNKSEVHKIIEEGLGLYRFKRVVYKWYEYDGGSYSDIKSPADGDLISKP